MPRSAVAISRRLMRLLLVVVLMMVARAVMVKMG